MDTELEELDAELEEFGKDALIRHVMAELELMRSLIELMRVEMREMKTGSYPRFGGFNGSPGLGPDIYAASSSGGMKTAANTSKYKFTNNTAKIPSDVQEDFDVIYSKLDSMIAESADRVESSKAEMDKIIAAFEA